MGCGIDISKLAPRGAKVNNTAKETSGAVSFMDLYSTVTGLIGQNGRRGALMISIDCNHPDLEEFIGIKADLDKITSANISIRMDNEFMDRVWLDRDVDLTFKREASGEDIIKTVSAKELFTKIAKINWDYAEPGILYWDRIKNWNLLSEYDNFEFAGTNPCGEEPLPAGGSCLLGSLNLAEFVKDGEFDFDDFKRAVDIAVRALNEVLDEGLPLHPLQEQRDSVRDWRQIGLGIFGLADMLIKMGVTYGDKESLDIYYYIGRVMIDTAMYSSCMLAKEQGAFPMYDEDSTFESKFFQATASRDTQVAVEKYGLRNSQLLTIAPTGTLSTMLGVSGGIEPMFATHYDRLTQSLHGEDKSYRIYTTIVKEYMEKNGLSDVSELPEYFVTSKDINHKNRIQMQSAWQDSIDASISSTINLPNDATVEDVMEIYMLAWHNLLKGITVYRDGCKRGAILSAPTEESAVAKNAPTELQ